MTSHNYPREIVEYANSQATVIGNQTKLAALLAKDVEASGKLLLADTESQFLRRAHIKTYFSYVEGVIWTFKRICLNPTFHIQSYIFSSGELDGLKEETARIDGNGNIKMTPLAISAKVNVKFTFQMLIKLFSPNFEVDFGDNGWQLLQRSIDVRNRITHPKSKMDLEISDDEIDQFGHGSIWFDKAVSRALDATETGYKQFLNRLKESVNFDLDRGRHSR